MEKSSSLAPIPNIQRLAEATHGVVTPANVLDVIAMVAAAWAAPRLDTLAGYAVGTAAYGADWIDGPISRWTRTSSRVGYYLDHVVGDKPKTLYALYHVWKGNLADKPVVGLAAAYNLSTAAITLYDRAVNEVPQVEVGSDAKKAFWGTSMAVGVQVGGNLVAKKNSALAHAARLGGLAISIVSIEKFGIPAIKRYGNQAVNGPKRPWARKLLERH